MKIVWRDDKGNLHMRDTITNEIEVWNCGNNKYSLKVGGAYVTYGSQNEMEELFYDIVDAEEGGNNVFKIE